MAEPNLVGNTTSRTDDDNQGNLLLGWSPTTTRLLLQATSHSYTVWDDVQAERPLIMYLELQDLFANKLVPARTTSDVVQHGSVRSRGDSHLFLDRAWRQSDAFGQSHPVVSDWIARLEHTAQAQLPEFRIDRSQTSVQIAEFAVGAAYPPHVDVPLQHGTPHRVVTALYYLTDTDWDGTLDDGCLRLHGNNYNNHYTDVAPYPGRTVIFRSDKVLHSVRPSIRRPRRALTVWLYGSAPPVSFSANNPIRNNHTAVVDDDTRDGPPALTCSTPMDTTSTIFVSVAAYRDSETGPTIEQLMHTAHNRHRIFVGLVLQVNTDDPYDRNEVMEVLPTHTAWWKQQVRVIQMDACHSTGPCNARAMCQQLYRNEDYFLQIDAHMRFRPNWDAYLIEQLQWCPRPDVSMLSTYPIGYTLPNTIPNEVRGTMLTPWKFDKTDHMLRIKGSMLKTIVDRPILTHLFAAGFNFAKGPSLSYDGSLHELFFGEELSMAVRLYTAGVDVYAPPQTVCFHLWTRDHRPASNSVVTVERQQQRRASLNIVRNQLLGRGNNGLGNVRTACDFARAIGVDFAAHSIEPLQDDKQSLIVQGSDCSVEQAIQTVGLSLHLSNSRSAADEEKVNALIHQFMGT